MSSCDIWWPGPGFHYMKLPEPCWSLDTATGTAASIAIFVQTVMGQPVGIHLSYLANGNRDLRKSAI